MRAAAITNLIKPDLATGKYEGVRTETSLNLYMVRSLVTTFSCDDVF